MSESASESFGSPSSVILTPGLKPMEKYAEGAPETTPTKIDPPEYKSAPEQAAEQLSKMPRPTGYRILILPYVQPPVTKGCILLTSDRVQQEQLATTVGYVVALGPDAYEDKDKYPAGPWCKEGDYVMFGRYAGAKISMQGEDNENLPLRLLNDDEIVAVVDNPEDYVGVL